MTYQNPHPAALRAASLNELLDHEEDIVRRINALPNGGQLLLLDPQRLLRELGVEMSAEAEEQCRAASGSVFADGKEHAYDAFKKSKPTGGIRVRVNGLFRRRMHESTSWFDFVIQIRQDKLLDLIQENVTVRGNSLATPFRLSLEGRRLQVRLAWDPANELSGSAGEITGPGSGGRH
jgi:hypothetical protein